MFNISVSNDLELDPETSLDALGAAADTPRTNTAAYAGAGLHSKRGQNALRLDLPKDKLSPLLHAERLSQVESGVDEEKGKDSCLGPGFAVQEETKGSRVLRRLSWVPDNLKLSRLRAVLRCSIGAWISVLLLLIPRTQAVLGRVSPWFFKTVVQAPGSL